LKDDGEGMDHSATCATATCTKSSSCGQNHDVNHPFESKQVTEDSLCNVTENAMEVQVVTADRPPVVEEQKSTETVSDSSRGTAHKIQTHPSCRLFQLSVQTVRDNLVQPAGQACRQTESSQSDDSSGSKQRRSKKAKLSPYGHDLPGTITGRGARHHHDDKQFDGKGGSGHSLVDRSEKKKEYNERERTYDSHSDSTTSRHHHDAKQLDGKNRVQSDTAKGKHSRVVVSGSVAEVVGVSKPTRRPPSKRVESVSAVVEKTCDSHSDEMFYKSSSELRDKKMTVSAKHRVRKKSVVETVLPRETEVKVYESEKKYGENMSVKLTQKGRKFKSTSNVEKMETRDEVRKGGDCTVKGANQTSHDLPHSIPSQKPCNFPSPVYSGRSSARCKPRRSAENEHNLVRGKAVDGNRANFVHSEHMSAHVQLPRSNLKKYGADCRTARASRDAAHCCDRRSKLMMREHGPNTQKSKTAVNAEQCSSFMSSSKEACVLEDWEAELLMSPSSEHNVTVVTCSVQEQEEAVEMSACDLYSTSPSSEHKVTVVTNDVTCSVQEQEEAVEMSACDLYTTVDVRGIASTKEVCISEDWETELLTSPTSELDMTVITDDVACNVVVTCVEEIVEMHESCYSTGDSHTTSTEKVRISEDWEAELLTFPPAEHNVTVRTNDVACNVEESCMKEVSEMPTCDLCSTVGDGSTVFTNNEAETLSTLTTESVEERQSNKQHLTSSGDFDCVLEQTQSELCDALTGEKYEVSETKETGDAGELLNCKVDVDHEIGVAEYDIPAVNCGKPDTENSEHNLTDVSKQRIAVSLSDDANSSNMPSCNAEHLEEYAESEEIIEPFEECSEEMSNGK